MAYDPSVQIEPRRRMTYDEVITEAARVLLAIKSGIPVTDEAADVCSPPTGSVPTCRTM